MKYLRVFESVSAYNTFADSEEYVEPNVSRINEDGLVKYNKARHDYSQDYLTFVFSTTGSITSNYDTLYFSNDNGETWVQELYDLNPGDRVLAKAYIKKSYSDVCYCPFSCEGNYSVEGNIMSIYDATGFRTMTSFESDNHDLAYFFYDCTGLTSAENLVLPATAVTYYCYTWMFEGCSSLTTAPLILPATTLAYGCYDYMFANCTGLTTAPSILPATTLAEDCYGGMFSNCSSLTTAPELPATTLAESCYSSMFEGCSGLTTAPELPATTLANSCYSSMFKNCTGLITAPVLPATTLASGCYSSMFENCTGLTTAPELSATTLASGCYYQMFSNCSSLNYIKCLATDISATSCTYNWINGVSQTGTFVKNPNMSSWTTGNNGIPTNWTVEDAS